MQCHVPLSATADRAIMEQISITIELIAIEYIANDK
jgi:hypothetical protein